MKVNVKKLPKGYSIVNGKIVNTMAYGGTSTGDQGNFGLITTPPLPSSGFNYDMSEPSVSGRVASSLPSVPREEANLEAEKGETVLTDMNNDGNFELYNIGGKRHHNGGTPLNLPPQSFIFSDTSKMKLDKYELAEMGIESKKRITPAKVSKGYELNKFMGILDDQHSDDITIDTAEYMLNKNKKSLSQLAFLQEAKKQFEDGVPLASYPYLTEKGIDPLQFSQQVEDISAQEAEQKMLMQLPFEKRLEIMMLKEEAAQQQAAMQQQQMMQQQGQMGAPQGMPQGMPQAMPQGMMPPQIPMQQPMAMAKRGGQMSQLYKAQQGIETGAQRFKVPEQQFEFASAPNLSSNSFIEDNTNYLPIHTQPENVASYKISDYIADQENLLSEYSNFADGAMQEYSSRFDPRNMQNMGAMGSMNSNIYDPEMVEFWEEHIRMGGTPPNRPTQEYTQAYAKVYPDSEMPNGSDVNMNTSYNEPYSESYNEEDVDQENQYVNNMSFPDQEPNSMVESNTASGFDATGLPLDYTDLTNPYYVGSQFAPEMQMAAYGGDLPIAQKGVEYNGETYSRKDLRKLSRINPNLVAEILNGGPVADRNVPNASKLIQQINESRIDEEGSDNRETLVGGTQSWIDNYQTDSEEGAEYRDQRYQAYKVRRESEGLSVLPAEKYHNLYIKFQKQNEWFKENLTQEERNTPDWDDGTNNKYIKSLEGSNFKPLAENEISHVQSGYIGGVSLNLFNKNNPGANVSEYIQSGVADQTYQEMAISGEDGKFGNTSNDQRELKDIGSLTEGTACSNADELATKCAEVGGVWTAYNAETKSGCSCSETIIEEQTDVEIPAQQDRRYWLQDNMGLMNAMDNKFSLQKYYPLATQFDNIQVDPVFKDPTREIAAIAEQATIAGMAGTTFAGPQRAAAVAAKTQGVAGKQIADAIDQVQSYNVGIANNMNVKNAELQYKTQMLNNNELKQLYDNTMLTEQNYDNALRESNAAITNQLISRETNAANTANTNSIYTNFNIQPEIGGDIDIVNPRGFYADANYRDPQTSYDEYIKMYDALEGIVPDDKIPGYQGFKGRSNKKQTNAQKNKGVIMQGYNQAMNGREVRKNNLLRKGAELRDWFSPLKGY